MYRFGSDKTDIVGSMQYDPKVNRKSIDDPARHHRRSSIPFVDRKPAVRFIRAIDQRKASIVGPHIPKRDSNPQKPILKKSNFPILVDASELGLENRSASQLSTNDELETCRCKTEFVMEKITKADRLARGGIDLLTFPTSTRRVEALSRYQGCMTISVCTIGIYSTSEAFLLEIKNKSKKPTPDARNVVDVANEMQLEAGSLHTTAKKFLTLAKLRYNEWEQLLKRNSEFRIEHSKLSYPIYTHKRMPESVTLYEDTLEAGSRYYMEGCVRICRRYVEDAISLHCDTTNVHKSDSVNFTDATLQKQMEIIKSVTSHGKDLLYYSSTCLAQGLDVLQDHDMDDAFNLIQRKINSLEYDDYFDPLCALELKNAMGELVARKAELLNTAEQILDHCKWIVNFTKDFYRYTKQSLKGGGTGIFCCMGTTTKKKILGRLGIVSVDDIMILMPLTYDLARDLFNINSVAAVHDDAECTSEQPSKQIINGTAS